MIEWVVERVFQLIPTLSELKKDKREVADAAIKGISEALTETSIYVEHISKGGEPDNDKEEDLARLWAKAAITLRHIDRQLAEVCEDKSRYWISPSDWPVDLIEERGIGLNQVRDSYKGLLRSA
jgi:hypothetical protein